MPYLHVARTTRHRVCGSGLGSFCSGARGGRKTRNGVSYVVESIGEDSIVAGGIRLTFVHLASTMRLPWAQTYASCQGTEFEGSLAIHDSDNKHFTMRHLFVALSRANRVADVSVI